MQTINAPLRSPDVDHLHDPRRCFDEGRSGGPYRALSQWDLLSRELTDVLKDSAGDRDGRIERWQKLSGAVYDFIETMHRTADSNPDERPDAVAPPAVQRFERLTARQHQVMELVVQGRTNKVIAYLLNISVRTVENHRAVIMRKTGVRTLPDLVRIAMAPNLSTGDSDIR